MLIELVIVFCLGADCDHPIPVEGCQYNARGKITCFLEQEIFRDRFERAHYNASRLEPKCTVLDNEQGWQVEGRCPWFDKPPPFAHNG